MSLKWKVALSLGLLIASALLITGGSIYWQAYQLAKKQAFTINSNATEQSAGLLINESRKARQVLSVLYDTPPVQGIIRARDAGGVDPLDHDSLAKWQERMASIFQAFLQHNADLSQIRYLDETGMEMVRVNSAGGKVSISPQTAFQNKADTAYFKATIQLRQSETYYSTINLNREHGRISMPHTPVFRMSTPIFDSHEKLRGILVINILARPLLAHAIPTEEGRNTYIINHDGYYLMHPDSARTFGFDLGFDFRLKDKFPAIADALSSRDRGALLDEKSGNVVSFHKIFFDPAHHQRFWVLIHGLPSETAFKNVTALQKTLILDGLSITLISILLILLLANRRIVMPIIHLAETAHRMSQGDLSVRLPTTGFAKEFCDVNQTLNEFAEAQQKTGEYLEQKIAERTEHLDCVVENLVDGLITISESGIVESFNPAAEKIFGYQADEVIGNNVKMLMPQPYKREHDGYLQHYMDTGEAKILGIGRRVEGQRKDGSTFPLDLAVNEMHIGDTRKFVGAVRNISERVAVEQNLANKNQELEIHGRYDHSYAEAMALFSATNDQNKALSGLLSILADHHPFPASAIYLYEEWSGTLKLATSHGAPETLQKEFERGEGLIGQAALDDKITILELESETGMTIETGMLTFNPTAVIISPICYQGKNAGLLVLASAKALIEFDAPFIERLCAQIGVAMNNLRQHRDLMELTAQLKLRGEEITGKNLQLEQANRMKSEFLANMSHELRTPLNAIIGFSEVLKDGVMGEMNKEQTEYIGDIFNSGQHLLSLINDILDLSKIEAGKMELDLEEINVPDLLSNSLSIIKEKAMAHRVGLTQDIGEGVENCWLDARKAKQIIFNLLSNAVKFTPDGGSVRLCARKVKGKSGDSLLSSRLRGISSPAKPETGSGELRSKRVSPGGKSETVLFFLEITVTDTGIGISEADQKKLFTAFVQADSSLSRKFEGTGLGLVMVKRLAELHGGTVDMQSKEGEGSTFTVCLPWRTEGMAPGSGLGKKGDSLLSSERKSETVPFFPDPGAMSVLIIEDEDSAADLMRVQLETEGYRTTRAVSAEQALDMLAKNKPDLITLDILMPGMDGWDFLAIIKKDKALAHIPVVIVSIVAGGNERKGFSLGATEVLQKPVSKKLLLASVVDAGLGVASGVSGTVLVVDDDSKAVELISRHLESGGATVLRAYGGAEAIDLAAKKHPDLIVLDLMMPEVTGFDVVDALKASEETARIPIIILTAKVITDKDRKALNGGVLKIVEKSGFNHGSFINEVQRATAGLERKKGVSLLSSRLRGISSPAKPETGSGELRSKRVSPGGKSETVPFFPSKTTVLVVEDNTRESNLLKRYLENAGYAVRQAGSGAIALEAIRECKPDLITLDMMMPDMDGFEFLNEKANLPGCLNIPVLIVSGMDNAKKGLSLGANAVVRKPIKKREFLDIVGSLGVSQSAEMKPDILVVDDDPKAVKIISSYFDAEAFQIIKAYGGEEALQAVNQSIPALIVLDLMMPDVDGFEVIHRLKRDKKTRNIPIIVLTAKILTWDERQELMRHVQAIEEKGSFNRDQFLAEVATLTG